MKRWIVCAFVVAAAGCASSSEVQMNADRHAMRASIYEQHGDYINAQRERQKANDQYLKASRRAYNERYWY